LGHPIYGEILAASTFLPTDPTVNSRRLWAAVNRPSTVVDGEAPAAQIATGSAALLQ
jgi:hypothetical protein